MSCPILSTRDRMTAMLDTISSTASAPSAEIVIIPVALNARSPARSATPWADARTSSIVTDVWATDAACSLVAAVCWVTTARIWLVAAVISVAAT